jgi:hypothetical protein
MGVPSKVGEDALSFARRGYIRFGKEKKTKRLDTCQIADLVKRAKE